MSPIISRLLVSLIFLSAVVLPVGGAVVNIDFQGWDGEEARGAAGAVLPSAGGYWNVRGESGEAGLLSSTGGGTEVRVWTSGFTGTRELGDAMYGDYLLGDVELRGLEAGAHYELVLYSAANIVTLFRVPGGWVMTPESADPSGSCTYWDTTLPGVEGCDYFRGTALADADGVIAIEANFGAIAGLQIDLAHSPEPSVLLLLALGGCALSGRWRRVILR